MGSRFRAGALAGEFEVSEDAIRRDLRALAAEGKCRRVYGGALPISPIIGPDGGADRGATRAQACTGPRCGGDDPAGRVPVPRRRQHNLALVEFLPEDNGLTIATNSIDIAGAVLRRQDLKLIVLGGEADPIIGGCVDAVALQALVQMRFDRAFIGACSVSEEGGRTAQLADRDLQSAPSLPGRAHGGADRQRQAARTAPHQVAMLGQIDMLVVEASAPPPRNAPFARCGGVPRHPRRRSRLNLPEHP